MAIEWFPHDYHARQDARVMHLLCTCMAQGYAAFWVCIECLHVNVTMTHEMLVFTVSKELGMTREDATLCIKVMLEVGLLKENDGYIFSQRVMDNLGARKDLVESKRKAANNRWAKVDAYAMHVHGKTDANALLLHNSTSHDNTGQVKNVHKNEHSERAVSKVAFSVPEVAQVCEYMTTIGLTPEDGEAFHDHYTANGWKVGKNPMKSWQSACRNWKRNKTTYGGNNARPNKRGDRNTDGSIDIVGYDQRIKRVLESARAQRQGTGGVVPSVPEKVDGLETGDLDRRDSLGMVVGDSGDGVQIRGNDSL